MGTVESKDEITTANFYVTKGSSGCLLSYESAVRFQIIPEISVISSSSSKSEQLCWTYSSIFECIHKLKMLKLTCTSTQMYSLFNSHTDAYLFM